MKPNSKVCYGLAPKIRLSYLSYFSFSLINRFAYINACSPESSLTSLLSFFFSSRSALLAIFYSKWSLIYFSIFVLALRISDLVIPNSSSSTNSMISSKMYIWCFDSQYFEKLAKKMREWDNPVPIRISCIANFYVCAKVVLLLISAFPLNFIIILNML